MEIRKIHAIFAGKRTYTSSTPCRRQHIPAVRYTTGGSNCVVCTRESNKRYREENFEARAEYQRKYRLVNLDRLIEYHHEYKVEYNRVNRERLSKYNSTYHMANRSKHRARIARRRARLLRATPAWLTKWHLRRIATFYVWAEQKTKDTGIVHHVDHVVPLKGKNVCGLHVAWNLRVLEGVENKRKGNRLIQEVTSN